MIGRIVGNYKIIQALGEGGVGMVYKGVDTMLDREVAIKILRPELASQNSVVERFRSEAVTLAKLSHPNIATLYSLFRDGQDLFMVLEFIKGETLDQTLYRQGRIPTNEAIPIFCQGLEGINYAHKLGIVHRDIKPGNMMLTEDGILKVLDFGIARLLGSTRMTRVGNVIGTLEYMSPEQVKGFETDARSDVYGMGIMLYEMLTGRLPFESENDFALMKMQTENIAIPPRQFNPEIPFEVENAVMKSIAKDPNQRFQSAGEFLEYFLDIGFAVPNNTLGLGAIYGRKNSRPSNPGINSGESSTLTMANIRDISLPVANVQDATLPLLNVIPQFSPPPMEPIGSKPEIPTNVKEVKVFEKENIGETRLAPKQGEIKGTRLADSNTPNSNELKATRLGAVVAKEGFNDSPNPSFFAKLNWIHFVGAGVIGFFLFTLVATAAVLPFVWGGEENPQKVEQKQPVDAGNPINPATPTIQPLVKEQPNKEPNSSDGGAMPLAPSEPPTVSNSNSIPIGTPTPNESKTSTPQQPGQKRKGENETARTNLPGKQETNTKKLPPKNNPGQNPNQGRSGDKAGSREEAIEVMTKPRKGDN